MLLVAVAAAAGAGADRFGRCGRRRVLLVFATMRDSHAARLHTTLLSWLAEENLPED